MKNKRSFAGPGAALAILAALLVAGCASTTPAPVTQGRGPVAAPPVASVAPAAFTTYTVKKGDTLYSIAREQGIDFRELIALNNIENAGRISEGVVLKIRPVNGNTASSSAVATTQPITSDVVIARPIGGGEPLLERRPLNGGSGNSETLKREPKGGKEAYSEQALALAQGQAKPAEAAAPAPAAPKIDEKPEAKPEAKSAEAPLLGPDDLAWIWPANGRTVGTFSESGSKGVDIAGSKGDPVVAAGDGKVVYSGTGLRGYGKLVIIKHNNTYLSAYAHNQTILVKEGQSVSKGQKIAEMGNTDADQVKLHFEVRRQGKPVDPLKYLPPR